MGRYGLVPDDKPYFWEMTKATEADPNNLWIELFCQRVNSLRSYSVRNVAKILLQLPSATEVAGIEQYKEQGVEVLPSALPIHIIAPKEARPDKRATGFGETIVYDISHTTGRSFSKKSPDVRKQLSKILELARMTGLQVCSANLTNGEVKILEGKVLYIKNGLSMEFIFQIICQELAYISLSQEQPIKGVSLNTAIAAVTSYLVVDGLGITPLPLTGRDKLTLCVSGLAANLVDCQKLARRISRALRKIKP